MKARLDVPHSQVIELFEGQYKKYKDHHWQQYYNKEYSAYKEHVNRVVDFFKDKKGRLLDVGCGDGLILNELSKNKNLACFGIDISKTGIEVAKNKGLINCEAVDLFDYDGFGYDYVYFGDTLEHLLDPEGGLKKVKQFIKPRGTIFIAVPMQDRKNEYDFHLFSKKSAHKLISKFFKILSFEQRLNLFKMYFVARKIRGNSN